MYKPAISCSTVSPSAIALFARDRYALPEQTTCRLLKAGINHTYCLEEATESYVFRLYTYNWRTVEEIEAELQLLQLLQQEGLSVSFPIADQQGKFIQELEAPEGIRYGVLFSFAEGEKAHNYDSDIHFEAGKLMAGMHKVTEGLKLKRVSYAPSLMLRKGIDQIGQFLSEDNMEMQFLHTLKQELEQQLSDPDIQHLRSGVVHLDIWFDNLNISGRKITLFDFDFCGNGWLCLDIAYYLLQLYNTEKEEQVRKQKAAAFMKGYTSIQDISEEEQRLIHPLGLCLYYFYLGVQCQRFENWSNVFLNETYLKRYITAFIKNYYEAGPVVTDYRYMASRTDL